TVMTIGLQQADSMVKFGGEFYPGGAGTDNGNAKAALVVISGRRQAQEALLETLRLIPTVQEIAMLSYAGGSEVVALTAQSDDQVIVGQGAFRQNFSAGVPQWRQLNQFVLSINALKLALVKMVVIAMRVGTVVNSVQISIDGDRKSTRLNSSQ